MSEDFSANAAQGVGAPDQRDDARGSPGWRHGRQWVENALLVLLVGTVFLLVSFMMDGKSSLSTLYQYEDATARMSVEQVDALGVGAFAPAAEMQSLRYTESAYWFRLKRPAAASAQRLVLQVQPGYVDDVRVYLPKSGGGWRMTQLGDRYPRAADRRDELAFTLDANVAAEQWLYVRTASSTALSVRVRLIDEADAARENMITILGVGLYGGGVLMLAMGAFLAALVQRNRFWALNGLFQSVTVAAVLIYFGVGHRLLWPDNPELAHAATNWIQLVHFFLGTVFYRMYVAQGAVPHWMLRMMDAMLALMVIQFLLLAGGLTREAFAINTWLVPLAGFTAACMSFGVRSDDCVEQFLLRLNMLGIFAYYVVFFLVHHQVLPATFILLYPGLYLNVVTAFALHLTLLRRTELTKLERDRASMELALTRQRAASERIEHEEDGRFLSMLLHEVRSPLSVIAFALGTLRRRLNQIGGQVEPLRKDLERIREAIGQMRGLFQEVEGISESEHQRRQTASGSADEAVAARPSTPADATLQGMREEFAQWSARLDASQWDALLASARLQGMYVHCGVPLIHLMMRNLVDNALKYSPPGSAVQLLAQVRVGAVDGEQWLVIGVSNEVGAAGFPDPGQLFRKYYRADRAKDIAGTGLGLYWVRGMARILGGDIEYASEGRSIRFALAMPIHQT